MTKVLIIDDEEDYCAIIKHFLKARNYQVECAHTLSAGLQMLEAMKPGILVLDNNLPDGEGWDHLKEILLQNPYMRIHLVSAYRSLKKISVESDLISVWEKPVPIKSFAEIFPFENN